MEFIYSYMLNCQQYENQIKEKVQEYHEKYILKEKQLYNIPKILLHIEHKKKEIIDMDENITLHILKIREYGLEVNKTVEAGELDMTLQEYVDWLRAETDAAFKSNNMKQNAILSLVDDYNVPYDAAFKYVTEEYDTKPIGLFEQYELLFIIVVAKNEFINLLNARMQSVLAFLNKKRIEKAQSALPKNHSIAQWKGTNVTEFVQFVYALFHSERLGMTNGEDEITKLVPEMAKLLNFDLGENWQGNHSKSIHNRNEDYEPPIFNEIRNGYKRYSTDIEEKKKKKK